MAAAERDSGPADAPATERELSDRLGRAVATYWSLPDGDQRLAGAPGSELRPVKGRGALVATLPEHAGRPAAFVKVFSDPTSFRREQRGLAAGQAVVLPSSGARHVRVPLILSTIEAAQALVMERVEGTVLATRLRRDYLVLRDRYVPALAALGAWLARLHAQDCPTGRHREVLDRQLSFIRATLEQAEPRLGSARAKQAGRLLARLGEELAGQRRPLRWCHGDFQPDNIIVSGRTLFVVDFAFSDGGWPEQDLVLLRHNLRTGLSDLPFGSRAARLLWSAFLTGYREVGGDARDPCTWDLCELRYQSFSVRCRSYLYERSARRKVLSFVRYVLGVRRFRGWLDSRVRAYGL